MLRKPQTVDDLIPPFQHIGDPQWADNLRTLLMAYEMPLPPPISLESLVERERALGVTFPTALRVFLLTFGSIDFDGIRVLPPSAIDTLDTLWFRNHLTPSDQQQLPTVLGIAETGSDDIYGLSLVTNQCCRYAHDPAGIFDCLPSFDDLIRLAVIDLSWSYYGWPDSYIEELAANAKHELFGW